MENFSLTSKRGIKVTVKKVTDAIFSMTVSDSWFFPGEWVKSEGGSIFQVLNECEKTRDGFITIRLQEFKLERAGSDINDLQVMYIDPDYFLEKAKRVALFTKNACSGKLNSEK